MIVQTIAEMGWEHPIYRGGDSESGGVEQRIQQTQTQTRRHTVTHVRREEGRVGCEGADSEQRMHVQR